MAISAIEEEIEFVFSVPITDTISISVSEDRGMYLVNSGIVPLRITHIGLFVGTTREAMFEAVQYALTENNHNINLH